MRAIDVSPLDAGLLDAVVRLVRLLDSPRPKRASSRRWSRGRSSTGS